MLQTTYVRTFHKNCPTKGFAHKNKLTTLMTQASQTERKQLRQISPLWTRTVPPRNQNFVPLIPHHCEVASHQSTSMAWWQKRMLRKVDLVVALSGNAPPPRSQIHRCDFSLLFTKRAAPFPSKCCFPNGKSSIYGTMTITGSFFVWVSHRHLVLSACMCLETVRRILGESPREAERV